MIEEWQQAVKRAKKRSASSIYSKRSHAIYKCALNSLRLTLVLIRYLNIIIKNQYYPERWMKTLDVIIEKGKGPVLGKLRTIQLIEANLQLVMRILVNNRNKHRIEKDLRIAKSNYRSRLRYSIDDAILEKRLIYDNSMLSGKQIIHNMTNSQAYYNR